MCKYAFFKCSGSLLFSILLKVVPVTFRVAFTEHNNALSKNIFMQITCILYVLHVKQDWLSPVYSGHLVHLLKFILHTPARWCIIRG